MSSDETNPVNVKVENGTIKDERDEVTSANKAENEESVQNTCEDVKAETVNIKEEASVKEENNEEGDPLLDDFYAELTGIKESTTSTVFDCDKPSDFVPTAAETSQASATQDQKSSVTAGLTSKSEIDRLNRPGSTYANLNPFDALAIAYDAPLSEAKQKFRKISVLVHPDKNPDDKDRAQTAFDAVRKAWKTLEDEKQYERCKEIVDEARSKTDVELAKKRRAALKATGSNVIPEDEDEALYKKHVHGHACKLFADLERLRVKEMNRTQLDKKRKAEEDAKAKVEENRDKEFRKKLDESRDSRVDAWKSWKSDGMKSANPFKQPQLKIEKRDF